MSWMVNFPLALFRFCDAYKDCTFTSHNCFVYHHIYYIRDSDSFKANCEQILDDGCLDGLYQNFKRLSYAVMQATISSGEGF